MTDFNKTRMIWIIVLSQARGVKNAYQSMYVDMHLICILLERYNKLIKEVGIKCISKLLDKIRKCISYITHIYM